MSGINIAKPSDFGDDGNKSWPGEEHHITTFNGKRLYAIVGGDKHGFWQDKKQLTDWVAWREVEHQTIGNNGAVKLSYTVAVEDSDGQQTRIQLSADHSGNPAKIITASGLPLHRPNAHDHAVPNMIAKFRHADKSIETTYINTGWQWHDGEWVFCAPRGSVTANGITHKVHVQSINETNSIGWDRVPQGEEEERKFIEAVMALWELVTDEWAFACIGVLFAAPLAMPERCGVLVRAERGSAKTASMRQLYSAITNDKAKIFKVGGSPAGMNAALVWHRHLLLPIDDYRRSNAKTDALQDELVMKALQGSYGGGLEPKANQDGTLRDDSRHDCAPVISAEAIISDPAIFERALPVLIRKGDIDTTEGGWLDQFTENHEEWLRAGFAGYLAYWAAELNASGEKGLGELSDYWAKARRHYAGVHGHDRAAEHVGAALCGWQALHQYADSIGLADLLPSWDELTEIASRLSTEARGMQATVGYGPKLIEAVQAILESQAGTLTSWNGGEPYGVEAISGYPVGKTHGSAAKAIGRWSKGSSDKNDNVGSYIVITRAGMNRAAKNAKLTIDSQQIAEALADYYAETGDGEWHPDRKVPRAWWPSDDRPRGHLFHKSVFFPCE